MPTLTRRSVFVAVAVVLVGYHLVAVTLASLPPNRYSDAATDRTAYLSPYFTQNWRLFAPNPVDEDREVLLQGAYTAADGSTRRTPWVNWTQVELDLVRHRVVGGRAGYVTNKLYGPLGQSFRRLDDSQRRAAGATSETDPAGWAELRTALDPTGRDTAAGTWLLYERATATLATDVLQGRWPDRDFTAVRYRLRSQGVVPYDARGGTSAERAAARPQPVDRDGGWRRPTPGGAEQRAVVADFDRRHR